MGNPSWGHGYRQGKADGQKSGGVIGVLIGAGATGAVALGAWVWGKLRNKTVDETESSAESVADPDEEAENEQS